MTTQRERLAEKMTNPPWYVTHDDDGQYRDPVERWKQMWREAGKQGIGESQLIATNADRIDRLGEHC